MGDQCRKEYPQKENAGMGKSKVAIVIQINDIIINNTKMNSVFWEPTLPTPAFPSLK